MFLHNAEHGEAPLISGLHRILHNYFAIGPRHVLRSFVFHITRYDRCFVDKRVMEYI